MKKQMKLKDIERGKERERERERGKETQRERGRENAVVSKRRVDMEGEGEK